MTAANPSPIRVEPRPIKGGRFKTYFVNAITGKAVAASIPHYGSEGEAKRVGELVVDGGRRAAEAELREVSGQLQSSRDAHAKAIVENANLRGDLSDTKFLCKWLACLCAVVGFVVGGGFALLAMGDISKAAVERAVTEAGAEVGAELLDDVETIIPFRGAIGPGLE